MQILLIPFNLASTANQTRSFFSLFVNFEVIAQIRQFERHPFSHDHPVFACGQIQTHQKAAYQSVTKAAPSTGIFSKRTVCSKQNSAIPIEVGEREWRRTVQLLFTTGDSLLLRLFSCVVGLPRNLQSPSNTLDLLSLLGTFRDLFVLP